MRGAFRFAAELFLVRSMKPHLLIIVVLIAVSAAAAQSPSLAVRHTAGKGKALAIYAPPPRYPTDARGRRPTGRGIVVMTIDQKTGWVTSARMEKSTGSKLLDEAAVEAFSKWRFKPGTVRHVHSPITFTVGQHPKT